MKKKIISAFLLFGVSLSVFSVGHNAFAKTKKPAPAATTTDAATTTTADSSAKKTSTTSMSGKWEEFMASMHEKDGQEFEKRGVYVSGFLGYSIPSDIKMKNTQREFMDATVQDHYFVTVGGNQSEIFSNAAANNLGATPFATFNAGVATPTSIDTTKLKFSAAAFDMMAAIGYNFGSIVIGGNNVGSIRTDFSANYDISSMKKGDVLSGDSDTAVNTVSFLANVYYDIYTKTKFVPYVGAGVGMFFSDGGLGLYPTDAAGGTKFIEDHNVVGLSWQASAGLKFNLDPSSSISLGYRLQENIGTFAKESKVTALGMQSKTVGENNTTDASGLVASANNDLATAAAHTYKTDDSAPISGHTQDLSGQSASYNSVKAENQFIQTIMVGYSKTF